MLSCTSLFIPALLFFVLGFFSRVIKSDLEIPANFVKILGIYLMIGIGLHGGIELYKVSFTSSLKPIFVALGMGFMQPLVAYVFLRVGGNIDKLNSSAIAAHYGSVSVGTFLTAIAFLDSQCTPYEPYPVVMLALMESPAILVGLFLAQRARQKEHPEIHQNFSDWGIKLLRNSLTNAGVILLLGSMLIGYFSLPQTREMLDPFYTGIFTGVLSLFLLAMGIEAAEHIHEFRQVGAFLITFGLLMPLLSGLSGVLIGHYILDFSVGGTTLVAVLGASASYIAVPPAMRMAVPEANPSFYLTLSLGITFPFNVMVGVPLYFKVSQWLLS